MKDIIEQIQALTDMEPNGDHLCVRCFNQYTLRFGLEPTPLCNFCAQEIVNAELPIILKEVKGYVEFTKNVKDLLESFYTDAGEDPDSKTNEEHLDLLRELIG